MLKIIPTPLLTEEKEGILDLSLHGIRYSGNDRRINGAIAELSREAGCRAEREGEAPLVSVFHGDAGEGYSLDISPLGVEIIGEGAAGAFYAVQSLRQLVCENGSRVPCCRIEDRPDLKYRGFYLDVSRGRVPTLKKLKEIVDLLCLYKINSLQLYFEHSFTFSQLEGIADESNALTPTELKELNEYCIQHFVDLVPSMASFGHMYVLLQSPAYNHLCELRGHEPTMHHWLERQWHHTVNVYDPESIKVVRSMAEQLLPSFSSEFFNICCDETRDLCMGANSGKDKGEAYFHHVEKLAELADEKGKRIMLWGDECMAHPDMAKERLPENAVILNWCYRDPVAEWIPKMFWERGFTQICCTGISCWEGFIENVNVSCGNIQSFAAHAKKYGALGILNTCWGDFGHVCPFNSGLYGMLMGAECSWRVEAERNGEFELAASLLLYGIREYNMIEALRRVGKASEGCSWSGLVSWYSANHIENKKTELRGPSAREARENIRICREEEQRLLQLGRNNGIITDLLLSVRAVQLMNRLYAALKGEADGAERDLLKRELELWTADYGKAWLRDDKPSELWRIESFAADLTRLLR